MVVKPRKLLKKTTLKHVK